MKTILLPVALMLAYGVVVPSPSYAARPTCFGERATIVDRPGGPRIVGTPGRDVIVSDDPGAIDARGGDDLICVTDRSGTIDAGSGDDRVQVTNALLPTTILGPGDDVYRSVGTQDTVVAGAGRDHVATGGLRDVLEFTGVTSRGVRIEAALGRLRIDGQVSRFSGIDELDASDLVTPALTIRGTAQRDVVRVGTDVERVAVGTRGGDDKVEVSGPHTGRITTGTGQDVLVVDGRGVGGDGLDVDLQERLLEIRSGATTSSIELGGVDEVSALIFDSVSLAGDGDDNVLRVRQACPATLEGRAGDDRLLTGGTFTCGRAKGNQQDNVLRGGRGDDALSAREGNDFLDGGPGRDRADGGEGVDTCVAEVRKDCELP